MSILIFAVVVLIVAALIAWAVQKLPLPAPFGMIMPTLNRASWESAERTGALEYMDYARVRAYADVYAMQEVVTNGQNDLLRRFPTGRSPTRTRGDFSTKPRPFSSRPCFS